ncbi:MAG: cytochrome P450 [Endozoicomonas sp.]
MKSGERFTPPYPVPPANKRSLLSRLWKGWGSWIHVVFTKSYTLKLGKVSMPNIDMFVVGEHKLVEKVLEKDNDQFPKHRYLAELLDPLIGESLFSVNGDQWKEQRTMLIGAFGHAHLKRAFGKMDSAARDVIEHIRSDSVSASRRGLHMDTYTTHVTADVIYRFILSKELGRDDSQVIFTAFHNYQKHAQRSFILKLYKLPYGYFARQAEKEAVKIRGIFRPYVESRYRAYQALDETAKASYEEKDMLDSIIRAVHPQTGRVFSSEEIIDQIAFIFLAGHETSASALTWTLYLLAKSPDLQERLYEEVQKVTEGGELAFEHIRKLEKTGNVFKEVLRLYPPVSFFMREAACPMTMRDKQVDEGSLVVVSPWLIQRSTNHWQNPHEFDPERFNKDNEQAQQRCPVHGDSLNQGFFPYGKGARICMGAAFAHQEAVIILAHILNNFKLVYTDSKEPEAISRVTTRPKHGVYVSAVER